MRKLFAFATLLFCIGTAALAQNTMTDQQVLDYVTQGYAEGKSRNEMMQELTLRGVDRAQAERVYALYNRQQDTNRPGNVVVTDSPRTHALAGGEETPETALSYQEAIPDQSLAVFGRDIFRGGALNFAPSENLATPRDYRLGPGDEVIIDIFGANQNTIRSIISPEGSIVIDYVGPIYLSGLTIEEANSYLKKRLSNIYNGLENRGENTDIRLTLGQIRSIQINVLGDVANPGTYSLSSLSTLFHALYRAGGIVNPGSMREIMVVRGGKTVAEADIYEFLVNGVRKGDIRLEEGDVVLVSPYKIMVKTSGNVKRPMYFEMKDGETVEDLLRYAGGFTSGAFRESVTITRQTGKSFEIRTLDARDFGSYRLQDGDEIEVGHLQSLFENRLTVSGSVYLPGNYELRDDIHTVRQLVEVAGGLLPDAFRGRAVIHREYSDRSKEVIPLNLGRVLDGEDADIELINNDHLYIASGFDLQDKGDVAISGQVRNPGTYPFADNITIEDLIIIAGGLNDGASLSRVDVTRRLKDDRGLIAQEEIARLYSFPIKDGLIDDGIKGFVLEPYDEVIVHRSPSYGVQRHVSISGEVNFAGTYSMTDREERISDLVEKAGGLTDFAYAKGARLVRTMNADERRQIANVRETMMAQGDTTSLAVLDFDATYDVSVELDKALANPGSDYDAVLREGDNLFVPVISNTVRVSGNVMNPSVLTYNSGLKASDYIELCGGYGDRAFKRHVYVVNMNGSSQRMRSWTKIEPGSEIVVPRKPRKNGNTLANILGVSTTAASLGTMAASIVNLIK